ncbi:MAG: hypothetical protein ACWA45_08605 [Flavobacteriales bacterium]
MTRSITYYRNLIFQRWVKNSLKSIPSLYIFVQKIRYFHHPYRRKIIQSNSDIVIEGFPRSANSFSVKAFKFANGNNYKIATHLHAYPQVILGVKYKIPTIVLIRNPFDCIVSYAALRAEKMGKNHFNIAYDLKWLLQDYVLFYKKLLPIKEQVIVAEFTEVLNDYGKFMDALNKKFKTNFNIFDHTGENVKIVFETSKSHLSPSLKREKIKKEYLAKMNNLKQTSLFVEAETLYKTWISL